MAISTAALDHKPSIDGKPKIVGILQRPEPSDPHLAGGEYETAHNLLGDRTGKVRTVQTHVDIFATIG
ncbi:hypothetical protein AWL63_20035 [Sphingomonas panacis]|uniref:Uncharacterized protein n=1 Tax=Sphingomonas panacis TaxID=1560345 RepID=A0A1B3ZEN8_9SPHN|nr:hypothetical protein AWL63_20035 [Sphingomonas panacis]